MNSCKIRKDPDALFEIVETLKEKNEQLSKVNLKHKSLETMEMIIKSQQMEILRLRHFRDAYIKEKGVKLPSDTISVIKFEPVAFRLNDMYVVIDYMKTNDIALFNKLYEDIYQSIHNGKISNSTDIILKNIFKTYPLCKNIAYYIDDNKTKLIAYDFDMNGIGKWYPTSIEHIAKIMFLIIKYIIDVSGSKSKK